MYAKKVSKDIEIRKIGKYHDFYFKSDTLLLADVFENLRKLCLKIDGLDLVKFLSTSRLAWQAALKEAEVN